MFEFSVDKGMKNTYIYIVREVTVGKVMAHLCLTLIVKELEISVEQVGNNTKYNQTLNIMFSVVLCNICYLNLEFVTLIKI